MNNIIKFIVIIFIIICGLFVTIVNDTDITVFKNTEIIKGNK